MNRNDYQFIMFNLIIKRFKVIPTQDCTTEETVVPMSIADTVTWKRAPVWSVNLGTSATGVNQVIIDEVYC